LRSSISGQEPLSLISAIVSPWEKTTSQLQQSPLSPFTGQF
jgi:hypothetical protein